MNMLTTTQAPESFSLEFDDRFFLKTAFLEYFEILNEKLKSAFTRYHLWQPDTQKSKSPALWKGTTFNLTRFKRVRQELALFKFAAQAL
jgi:hypothetical protein